MSCQSYHPSTYVFTEVLTKIGLCRNEYRNKYIWALPLLPFQPFTWRKTHTHSVSGNIELHHPMSKGLAEGFHSCSYWQLISVSSGSADYAFTSQQGHRFFMLNVAHVGKPVTTLTCHISQVSVMNALVSNVERSYLLNIWKTGTVLRHFALP